ncbi:MAG: hypothetical protein R3B97_00695 [Dehalococcoidia bacterium]|nr:hypothetical protein [Thermoflexaceae bacterium]
MKDCAHRANEAVELREFVAADLGLETPTDGEDILPTQEQPEELYALIIGRHRHGSFVATSRVLK